MKKLIVNADDFGLTHGVNKGTIEAFKKGIVRSTTLMVNAEAAKEAFELAKENPDLGVGIHLVLTANRPVLENLKHIVDEEGNFLKQSVLRAKQVDLTEVEMEFRAQIEKMISNGVQPTHIDSHHHVHKIDEIFQLVMKLAKELGVPVRDSKEDAVVFDDRFYGEEISVEMLIEICKSNEKNEIVEIMVHPAVVDELLTQLSSYDTVRAKELDILTSDTIQNYIQANGIELINYSNL